MSYRNNRSTDCVWICASVLYKQVDFSFFQGTENLSYRGGNTIPGSGDGSMGNIYTNYQDRWTVENPRQDVFGHAVSYNHANNTRSSLVVKRYEHTLKRY